MSVTSIPSVNRSPVGTEARRGTDVVVLSSSLLTDRMFLFSRFLQVLGEGAATEVWASSASNPAYQEMWVNAPVRVEALPAVQPFREFPHNFLRRVNEYAWDLRLRPPSRLSMERHVRQKRLNFRARAARWVGRAVALTRQEAVLEKWLEPLLLGYSRSPEAQERLRRRTPEVLLTTGPFWYTEPAVAAAAKQLGIRTLAMIPSWDNVTTKGRMVFQYDGYLVWSEQTKQELHQFYPQTRDVPVYVVGAPQFDVFFQERFRRTREEFCRAQGLRPDRPIVVYAVGSPNFLQEHHGAVAMAERVARGELGDAQLLVRPHPAKDNAEMVELFRRFPPSVCLQRTAQAGMELTARSQNEDQVVEWINTFRHADVVVNLSSTVTIDAAIFDRPVVNLDYDPEPGQPNQALVKDVNHLWSHFKPVAESGGVWLVNNLDETVHAVRTYLDQPELHRQQRRQVAERICGYLDGRCGERMAEAILAFTHSPVNARGAR